MYVDFADFDSMRQNVIVTGLDYIGAQVSLKVIALEKNILWIDALLNPTQNRQVMVFLLTTSCFVRFLLYS